jgi:hypothetical protein
LDVQGLGMHKKARNLFRQMLVQLGLPKVHFLRQVWALREGGERSFLPAEPMSCMCMFACGAAAVLCCRLGGPRSAALPRCTSLWLWQCTERAWGALLRAGIDVQRPVATGQAGYNAVVQRNARPQDGDTSVVAARHLEFAVPFGAAPPTRCGVRARWLNGLKCGCASAAARARHSAGPRCCKLWREAVRVCWRGGEGDVGAACRERRGWRGFRGRE